VPVERSFKTAKRQARPEYLLLLCCLFVLSLAAAGYCEPLAAQYEPLFVKYFSDKILAKSVLPVIMATDDELRRGKIPTLNLCLEDAEIEGVRFDRLLLVMRDVLFTAPARGVVIHSHGESSLSGGVSKETFLANLSAGMPHFAVSELELKDGRVMIKGVYDRRLTFRVRALMRFTGAYVIDGEGAAKIKFVDATNDNPAISTLDVGRAISAAATPLSFVNFFGATRVKEVLVDHDMVWFSAESDR